MKKFPIVFVALLSFASCKKTFTKDSVGKFDVDGTHYETNEDNTTANYYGGDNSKLQINIYAGQNQTNQVQILVDLNQINDTVSIAPNQEAWSYLPNNSSTYYLPISGEWIITSHKEGNPATRHTEGNFHFVAVDQYNMTDTIRITNGYFFHNNY